MAKGHRLGLTQQNLLLWALEAKPEVPVLRGWFLQGGLRKGLLHVRLQLLTRRTRLATLGSQMRPPSTALHVASPCAPLSQRLSSQKDARHRIKGPPYSGAT